MAKIYARNNLLRRLAGCSWGSNFALLQTSVLALSYSSAEYCCPIWSENRHIQKIDSALNEGMRLISGAIRSTPTEQLPTLCGILPPDIRRQRRTRQLFETAKSNPGHMLHSRVLTEIQNNQPSRLRSRNPLLRRARSQDQALPPSTWAMTAWQNRWNNSNCQLKQYMPTISTKPVGNDLGRAQWVQLNRLRSGHGRFNHFMHRIGLRENPNCTCGEPQTAAHVLNCQTIGIQGSLTDVDENFRNWLSNTTLEI